MSVRRDCRNKPRKQGPPGRRKWRPARTAAPSERVASSSDARALKHARAQADAAIAKSNAAHARLREALEILPQGIVFLDTEGRYILWNQKYADIYKRSADLFKVGASSKTRCASASRGRLPGRHGPRGGVDRSSGWPC